MLRGYVPNQWNVSDFKRRNLVYRIVEAFQKINCRLVERCRKTYQAFFFGNSENLLVPFPRSVGFFVQVIQSFTFPQTFAAYKIRFVAIQCQCVSSVSLNFNCVSSCFFRRTNCIDGDFLAVIVVCRHLGYDECSGHYNNFLKYTYWSSLAVSVKPTFSWYLIERKLSSFTFAVIIVNSSSGKLSRIMFSISDVDPEP